MAPCKKVSYKNINTKLYFTINMAKGKILFLLQLYLVELIYLWESVQMRKPTFRETLPAINTLFRLTGQKFCNS